MKNFDAIFNAMFLAVFIYHIFYFLVQYFVFKRVELFYYSMYLLSVVIYYYGFVTSKIFDIKFPPALQTIFSASQFAFGFITYYLYAVFITSYLNLTKNDGRPYYWVSFFKYYSLAFSLIFLFLGILNIESAVSFDIFSILVFPLIIICLINTWKLNTTHASVIIWGTTFTGIGAFTSIAFIVYQVHSINKLPFNEYVPNQIGGLLDLFILGYGLSLKAAESDKKLVQYLQEDQKLVEAERTRVARDLHDGLGGMLSGIKLTLGSISGTVILPVKSENIFKRALGQLDDAVAEMRRVAHSMIPEALLKFGLAEAILDYCDGINESNILKMKFTQLGSQQKLARSTEVILYRIVQELSNNAIKHAAPKNIFIQLDKHASMLILTVEDDGKGFNGKKNGLLKGAGLRNVQSRIDYLKGNWDIKSAPGTGTSVTIEIPV